MAKTYDPKQFSIIVGGHIVGGYEDGTFIKVERNEDMWATKVGADGEGARAKSNNKSGTVELTLLQSSDSNDVLSGFALADEISNGGQVPVLIKDSNGTTVVTAQNAWVRKMAPIENSKEIGNRVWTLETDVLDMLVGGNS